LGGTTRVEHRKQICKSVAGYGGVALALIAIIASLPVPARAHNAVRRPEFNSTLRHTEVASAYLQLSVDAAVVSATRLTTLHISYHNIGLPYTTITLSPSALITFDPPLAMPCKYDQHPNGCTAITLRALVSGVVTITASATGEVYDEDCMCWYWGGGSAIGPAQVVIGDSPWHMMLPMIRR
jgi:hypothetical protein